MSAKIMCMKDFEREFRVRLADRCCANCKHGDSGYEGAATCWHPFRNDGGKDYEAGKRASKVYSYNSMQHEVCDLWEPK